MSRSFNSSRKSGKRERAPKWVRHEDVLTMRTQTNALLRKVLKLADLEDTPVFPIDRRPKEWHHWL
jgi:hypothetical protein